MGVFRALGLELATRLGKGTYHIVIPCICWKMVLKLVACHDPTLPIPAAHTCQTAGSTAVLEVARLTELMCRFAFGEQIPIPRVLGTMVQHRSNHEGKTNQKCGT